MSMEETFQTVVIGGGQAGLAAGYFLSKQNKDFVILDENERTGAAWRNRWDGLRLFTPSQYNSLPGKPFPGADYYFPTKDETAGYLQDYAESFHLPVRHGARVETLASQDRGYLLRAGNTSYSARNVIVAAGAFHVAHSPAFASQLDPGILQMHSSCYHNPEQIHARTVLVVGAGNSGAEIALELARAGKKVWLAGRDVGRIPADILGRAFGGRSYWWFVSHVLSIDTPIGRKMKSHTAEHGNPLIRSSRKEVAAAGIESTPRMKGVQDGLPLLEDGRSLQVEAVIWATGFRPDYSWIKLPIFDEHGFPRHQRGVVPEAPGLYFLGLHFQTALTSALLGGVGANAGYITAKLAADNRTA